MKKLIILLSAFILLGAQCRKTSPVDDFYFRCYVDGKEYIPNNCVNCRVAKLLGDTTLLINANRGYESILIGIIKLDKIPIAETSYILDANPQQKASYDNSPLVNDIYETDSTNPGELRINILDKQTRIISGTFYFTGFNKALNKNIKVTRGSFRLKYNTN